MQNKLKCQFNIRMTHLKIREKKNITKVKKVSHIKYLNLHRHNSQIKILIYDLI